MEYHTNYAYEEYSIDKSIVENLLDRLYKNSISKMESRNKEYLELINASEQRYFFDSIYSKHYNEVREKDKEMFPFLIQEMDRYFFFLVSGGYINSKNFDSTLNFLKNYVDKIIPAVETDMLIASFNDSVAGLHDHEEFSYKYKTPAYIAADKTLKITQDCFGPSTIFHCIRSEFNCLLAEKVVVEATDYYNQIKGKLTGYNIEPEKFDQAFEETMDFLYYCLAYELYRESDIYNGYEWDNRDKYKSVLLNNKDLSKYSFQDEIREVMATFIKTDPEISQNNKKTSTLINAFTKKCLEGDYFKNRCEEMNADERDNYFMALYHLGTLKAVLLPPKIKEQPELAMTCANNLVEAVDRVNKHKGTKKNDQKNN